MLEGQSPGPGSGRPPTTGILYVAVGEAFHREASLSAASLRRWFSDAADWFIRARESGAVVELMPDVLTYHRMHERNLTRRRSEASKVEFARVVGESLMRRRAASAKLKEQ